MKLPKVLFIGMVANADRLTILALGDSRFEHEARMLLETEDG